MKITLHIGIEKTGTTFLQEVLLENQVELAKNGILFPSFKKGRALELTACAIGKKHANPVLRALGPRGTGDLDTLLNETLDLIRSEQRAHQCERLLLSDEHLFAHMPCVSVAKRYVEQLSSIGEIDRIIVYLRRQDDLFSSIMSQAIKERSLRGIDFEQPFSNAKNKTKRLNYFRNLQIWQAALPNAEVEVRPFGKAFFEGGNLVSDFCSVIGIPTLSVCENRKSNLSIHPVYYKALAKLIHFISENSEIDCKNEWPLFVSDLSLQCGFEEGIDYGEGVMERFLEMFQFQNRKIATQYDVDTRLFEFSKNDCDRCLDYNSDSLDVATFERRTTSTLKGFEEKYPSINEALQRLRAELERKEEIIVGKNKPEYEILKKSNAFEAFQEERKLLGPDAISERLKSIYNLGGTALITKIKICEELSQMGYTDLCMEFTDRLKPQIQTVGNNPFVMRRYAKLLNQLGTPVADILVYFESIIENSDSSPWLDMGWANILWDLERFDKALEFLESRSYDWLESLLFLRVAELKVEKKDFTGAIIALKSALECGIAHYDQFARLLSSLVYSGCVSWEIEGFLYKLIEEERPLVQS